MALSVDQEPPLRLAAHHIACCIDQGVHAGEQAALSVAQARRNLNTAHRMLRKALEQRRAARLLTDKQLWDRGLEFISISSLKRLRKLYPTPREVRQCVEIRMPPLQARGALEARKALQRALTLYHHVMYSKIDLIEVVRAQLMMIHQDIEDARNFRNTLDLSALCRRRDELLATIKRMEAAEFSQIEEREAA